MEDDCIHVKFTLFPVLKINNVVNCTSNSVSRIYKKLGTGSWKAKGTIRLSIFNDAIEFAIRNWIVYF